MTTIEQFKRRRAQDKSAPFGARKWRSEHLAPPYCEQCCTDEWWETNDQRFSEAMKASGEWPVDLSNS